MFSGRERDVFSDREREGFSGKVCTVPNLDHATSADTAEVIVVAIVVWSS